MTTPTNTTALNLTHRLYHEKETDLSNINHVVDCVDTMSSRAIGILNILSGQFADQLKFKMDDESIYFALQAAIAEIKDIDALVTAHSKNKQA